GVRRRSRSRSRPLRSRAAARSPRTPSRPAPRFRRRALPRLRPARATRAHTAVRGPAGWRSGKGVEGRESHRFGASSDTELLDPAAERARMDAEHAGGTRRALDAPVGLAQDCDDVVAFDVVA